MLDMIDMCAEHGVHAEGASDHGSARPAAPGRLQPGAADGARAGQPAALGQGH